jgi:hypothetical protein
MHVGATTKIYQVVAKNYLPSYYSITIYLLTRKENVVRLRGKRRGTSLQQTPISYSYIV